MINVFDLRGPAFLQFYLPLLIGSIVVGALLRWFMRSPGGDAPSGELPDDPYDIALLRDGPRAAILAAAASLVQRELLTFRDGQFLIGPMNPAVIRNLHPLEREVHATVAREQPVRPRTLAKTQISGAREDLMLQRELLVAPEKRWTIRLASTAIPFATLTIGVIKLAIGASRGRPIGILLLLLFIALIACAVLLATPTHRTRRGDRALRWMRGMNEPLRTNVQAKSDTLAPTDIALACALFGPAVFAGADDDALRTMGRHFRTTGEAGSSSSGCGASSCGGSSCGGGGGCGGGGCGGGCGGCGG